MLASPTAHMLHAVSGGACRDRESLRRSDPLIRPEAWHDWAELYAKVRASHAAHIHQQALIQRALHAHARRTASAVSKPPSRAACPLSGDTRASWAPAMVPVAPAVIASSCRSPPLTTTLSTGSKRPMPLGCPHAINAMEEPKPGRRLLQPIAKPPVQAFARSSPAVVEMRLLPQLVWDYA